MNTLVALHDKELLRRTEELARQERKITVQLLAHLQEIERRELFLEMGYGSLYDFVIKALKFSEGAAYRRIQAMRLVRDVPSAAKKLEEGLLSVCKAAKVQTAAKKLPPEDKEKLLQSLEGKSGRETDQELAGLDPKGPREFTRWLNPEEVQLTFSLQRPDFLSMQELQEVRSHKDTQKTYRVLVTDLIKLGQDKWNPLRRTANSAVSSQCVNSDTLSDTLRTQIWKRDQGRCSFKNPETGQVCGSKHLVQIDHIEPLALGGKNELANLRLLCAAHNQGRARKTFGGN